MRSTLKILVVGYVVALLGSSSLQAQAPRSGAAERDRGLWNRLGSRREERFNRNAPQPPAQQPPAAQPPQRPGALGANTPPVGRNGSQANRAPAANQGPQSNPGNTVNSARTPAGGGANANQFSAGYAQSERATPNSLPGNDALRPAPSNRLPYNGPGVLIRLPERLKGEVNYLIDDEEHLIVHSGESQHLPRKDRYEVRFSRGVKADGQSYGEARYTISEGIYRFDVSANGWELYREAEGSEVAAAVRQAMQRDAQIMQASAQANPLTEPSQSSAGELPTKANSSTKSSQAPLPSPASKDSNSEDTLPAPRSILER